jgi:flagellar biosynthesis protein
MKENQTKNSAVSLKYSGGITGAPKVTAKGQGWVAERIIALAQEQNIPIRKDKDLVELLEKIDVGKEIPASLYKVVAELLAWVYQLNNDYPESKKNQRIRVNTPL